MKPPSNSCNDLTSITIDSNKVQKFLITPMNFLIKNNFINVCNLIITFNYLKVVCPFLHGLLARVDYWWLKSEQLARDHYSGKSSWAASCQDQDYSFYFNRKWLVGSKVSSLNHPIGPLLCPSIFVDCVWSQFFLC